MADVSVRPATLADIPAVTSVQLAAWKASGLPGVPDPAETKRAWERAVLLPPSPRHRLLVALAGGEVVGVAATVPASDPDLDPAATSELALLAVDPERRTLGHGSRLLAAAVDLMREAGDAVAVAWLPAGDDPTRRFLAGAGWGADGAHRSTSLPDEMTGAADLGPVRWLRLATDLGHGSAAGAGD